MAKIENYYNELSKIYDKKILDHPYEKYRFQCITEKVLGLMIGKEKVKILDAGCGTGTFNILPISQKFSDANIYAIDISEKMIDVASRRFPKFTFQVADAHNLPFKSDFFDVVISRQVFEHLKDPLQALKEIKRVTKKNGTIIVSTPSWFGLIGPLYFVKKANGSMQPIDNWWTPFSLSNLFKKAGLKIESMTSVNVIPYHKKLPDAFIPIIKFFDRRVSEFRLFNLFGRTLIIKAIKID